MTLIAIILPARRPTPARRMICSDIAGLSYDLLVAFSFAELYKYRKYSNFRAVVSQQFGAARNLGLAF